LDSFVDELNALAIPGLEFFGARLLAQDDLALAHLINEARLVAAIPRRALAEEGINEDALREIIEARLNSGALTIHRESRGGIKRKIDVRRTLKRARVGEGYDAIEAAGLAGDLIPLELIVSVDPEEGRARPIEILEALIGSSFES